MILSWFQKHKGLIQKIRVPDFDAVGKMQDRITDLAIKYLKLISAWVQPELNWGYWVYNLNIIEWNFNELITAIHRAWMEKKCMHLEAPVLGDHHPFALQIWKKKKKTKGPNLLAPYLSPYSVKKSFSQIRQIIPWVISV